MMNTFLLLLLAQQSLTKQQELVVEFQKFHPVPIQCENIKVVSIYM